MPICSHGDPLVVEQKGHMHIAVLHGFIANAAPCRSAQPGDCSCSKSPIFVKARPELDKEQPPGPAERS